MTDQEQATRRSRSPSYPYLNLEDAIRLLKVFYDKHRDAQRPLKIALEEMGYSITSGTGARVTSALAQFGLFEVEGSRDERQIQPTRLALEIIDPNPKNPHAQFQAIQEAALLPDMHRWVYDHYELGHKPFPQKNVLEYELRRIMQFQDNAIEPFIKEFVETYEYARLDELSSQEQQAEEPEQHTQDATNVESSGTVALNPSSPISSDMDELTTRLTQGKIARLILPKDMNRMDFKILAQWLDQLREASLYESGVEDNTPDEPGQIPF